MKGKQGKLIETGCGNVSPPLTLPGEAREPEMRFSCQKQLGHRGDHRIVLEWNEPPMFDTPIWMGGEA